MKLIMESWKRFIAEADYHDRWKAEDEAHLQSSREQSRATAQSDPAASPSIGSWLANQDVYKTFQDEYKKDIALAISKAASAARDEKYAIEQLNSEMSYDEQDIRDVTSLAKEALKLVYFRKLSI